MSLLFPAYLAGLLGLLLPWILHRFSDQNPPEQLFPSKRFLEATTPPVSRKRTLKYKTLLALRIVSLLLLCLLFAQPWINRGSVPATQQHHMIVLDQSLSMRATGRWSSAIDKAEELISELGEGSASLVVFDRQVRVLASTSLENVSTEPSLAAALDNLEPGYAPGDYGLLMQRLNALAAEQELPVKVWLISDMQLSSLPAQLNALYAPNVKELELAPVGLEDQVNVHLAAEANSSDGATADLNVLLLASVSGANSESINKTIDRTVLVESNSREIERRSVSLVPGELFVASFDNLVLAAESAPDFSVSLVESDALPEDNVQRIPIIERQATGVVLLSTPGAGVGSASVFVTTALETDGLSQVESIRGNVSQVPPDTPHLVTGRDLSTPLGLDLLQFVDTGSNALVFNQAAYAEASSVEFDGTGIGTMDESHPLALGDIVWFGTRFYDLPEFNVLPDDRVLLQSESGQIVLIERPTNRGHLLILNDPLDGLASNLPLQPAFVALLQSVIRYFDASTSVPSQIVIGERLALPANVQLIDTNGDALLDIAQRAVSTTVELAEPGIYTVVSVRGEQKLRAVLDMQEANLSSLGEDAMTAWQARYAENETSDDEIEHPLPNGIDPKKHALWPWLLPLAALLLFAEGWFANQRLHVRRDGS